MSDGCQSVSRGAAPHGLDVDLWCPRDKAVSRPSPAGLDVVGASAISFLNALLAHVCPATRSAAFQRSDASVAFGADKILWPCQNMPPYLQYSRLSSRLVFLSGPKWRVRSGAFDTAWCSCNGPWPHQAWRKMAWPLARCGLIEIQCIRRGTRFPCAHRRAPREASPAADRFCRV